jgi:branched-chain amino acid transport system substrate-binding protein
MTLYRGLRAVLCAVLAALLLSSAAGAADPFEINVILTLTGGGTFTGVGQQQAIELAEGAINRAGGIGGRPVKFVIADNQTNPQVSIQLMQALIARKVQVVLGPSDTASCNAIAPLVAQNGPVAYCLTASGKPVPGGYVFSTLTSTPDLIAVAIRYFRERGWKRMAYLLQTDASGQDAEQGLLADVALPENKGLEVVDAEHLAPGDISVSAQLARIKAANPQVLLAWVTGTGGGTILRGMHDAGIDMPVLLSPGNMTDAFTKQYGPLLTDTMFLPGMAYYGGTERVDARTRTAMNVFLNAYRGAGAVPNQVAISAWDPALFVVEALRRAGLDAPASKIRDALIDGKDWVGVNGPYDYHAYPNRGIGRGAIVMVRWDTAKGTFVPISALGGAPLNAR